MSPTRATTWLRTSPFGVATSWLRLGRESEDAAVEQHRLVEALPRLGEVDVVNAGHQSAPELAAALELRHPAASPAEARRGRPRCRRGRGRPAVPARWRGYGDTRSAPGALAPGRPTPRGPHLEADRRHGRGPVAGVLLVADDPRRPRSTAVRPCCDAAAEREAELAEQHVDLAGVVGADLHEVEASGGDRGQRRAGPRRAGGPRDQSSSQMSERRACTAVRTTSV